jgi:transcriptional regulator with PAS, ATPase and Fis domain
MVLASALMRRVLADVRRIARFDGPVLVTGETGTGKELIARAIHQYSSRKAKPFIDFSCAAIPQQLIESELFGYEKGAFSGAVGSKPGYFDLAHGGSLFLDEIGELEPAAQAKLLRVLDGTPHFRLGGTRKVTADVRVVAATNQSLEQNADAGSFRKDLLYRLAQFRIAVPPLRERTEDVGPIAGFVLNQLMPGWTFSGGAVERLCRHSWPGNIRELRNVVARCAALNDTPLIESAAVDNALRPTDPGPNRTGASLEAMEQSMILLALSRFGGHQQLAAASLGISSRTISRKLKQYAQAGSNLK